VGAPGLDPGTSGLKELANCCVVSVWSRMSKNFNEAYCSVSVSSRGVGEI
jgi:hypothetical protein